MKAKKKLILNLIVLVMITAVIITSVFAWIIPSKNTYSIIITSGNLSSDATLYYYNNEYLEYDSTNGQTFSNVVSRDNFQYKILVTNTGSLDGTLEISASNVEITNNGVAITNQAMLEAFDIIFIDETSSQVINTINNTITIDATSTSQYRIYNNDGTKIDESNWINPIYNSSLDKYQINFTSLDQQSYMIKEKKKLNFGNLDNNNLLLVTNIDLPSLSSYEFYFDIYVNDTLTNNMSQYVFTINNYTVKLTQK